MKRQDNCDYTFARCYVIQSRSQKTISTEKGREMFCYYDVLFSFRDVIKNIKSSKKKKKGEEEDRLFIITVVSQILKKKSCP